MTRYIDADELEKRTVLVEGDEFDGEYFEYRKEKYAETDR